MEPVGKRLMGRSIFKGDVMIVQSATRDKIDSLLPKGHELISHKDDGVTLEIVYKHNGKTYRTKVASTARCKR